MKLNKINFDLMRNVADAPEIQLGKSSIVHFGVGGFHRAHQAVYTEDAMLKSNDFSWGITGVGIMPNDYLMRDVLRSQDFLYAIIVKPSEGKFSFRIISSIYDYIWGAENHEKVFEKISDNDTKIITLTVTEGGYNINQRTGQFGFDNSDIIHDLNNYKKPKTIFGFLAESLNVRMNKGRSGITIMSCDNVQHNGDVVKKMLLIFLRNRDEILASWVEQNCSFPNSMVDRITPQTTNEDKQLLKKLTGIEDEWPVTCEPFTQWVIEDKFVTGRPQWELGGAQFVDNVAPYEKIKLRLLNAAHQAMCYLGYLHGYRYIHEVAQDPVFDAYTRKFMKEAVITLDPVFGIDLDEYQNTLMVRFSNPNIRDHLSRICEYSSDRIPIFNVPAMIEQLDEIDKLTASTYVIAGWLKYAQEIDEEGNPINIIDNRKDEIIKAAKEAEADPCCFLKFEDMFGRLSQDKQFRKIFTNAFNIINEFGARKAIEMCINT